MFQPNTHLRAGGSAGAASGSAGAGAGGAAASDCGTFVPGPGMEWAGMACQTCGVKSKDHSGARERPPAAAAAPAPARERKSDEPAFLRPAPTAGAGAGAARGKSESKAKKETVGTTAGSLGSFMGASLGVKHSGASTGLVKDQPTPEEERARAYHANKEANKAMAKAFSASVMAAMPRKPEDHTVAKPSTLRKA